MKCTSVQCFTQLHLKQTNKLTFEERLNDLELRKKYIETITIEFDEERHVKKKYDK